MIIVDQNRNGFINFDNVLSINTTDEDKKLIIASLINNSVGIILGQYETEERSKEVLREIVGHWETMKNIGYYMPEK